MLLYIAFKHRYKDKFTLTNGIHNYGERFTQALVLIRIYYISNELILKLNEKSIEFLAKFENI